MNNKIKTILLYGFLLMFFSTCLQAADLEREKRLRAEIQDAIMDGDPEDIMVNGKSVLGIYTDAGSSPKGAVIILHGRGFHPDWVDVVQPLRVGLIEKGWSTLSLQMPVLDKKAKYYDYVPVFPEAVPRIDAAIKFLQARAIKNIVIVAHSCGAHMAMHWFKQRGDKEISAFVGLGMGATDYKQPMKEPFPLASVKVPVLDAYGSDEFPGVLKMVPERAKLIKQAGNPKSKQMVVEGANHYFEGKGQPLLRVVADWLDTL